MGAKDLENNDAGSQANRESLSSTSAHTPGPWYVTEFMETIGYDCMTGGWAVKRESEVISPAIVVIDQADYGQPRCDFSWRSKEAEANARLIAAAPTMLMALIDLSVIAQQHIDDLAADVQEGRKPDAVWKMEMHRWQSVLDAIAKAEGRQS